MTIPSAIVVTWGNLTRVVIDARPITIVLFVIPRNEDRYVGAMFQSSMRTAKPFPELLPTSELAVYHINISWGHIGVYKGVAPRHVIDPREEECPKVPCGWESILRLKTQGEDTAIAGEFLEVDNRANPTIAIVESRGSGKVHPQAREVFVGDIITRFGGEPHRCKLGDIDDLRVVLRPVLEHLGGGLSPGEQPVEGIGLIDLINRPCRDSIDAPLVGYKPIIPMVYGCGLIVGDLASAKDAIPPGRNERLKRRGSNFLEKF